MTLGEQQALIRSILRIFRNWNVGEELACQILGEPDVDLVARWRVEENSAPSCLVLERMAIVLMIHAGLRRLYREPERGYAWMQRPNMSFDDRTPIAMIVAGGDEALLRVKAYLDAETQPW